MNARNLKALCALLLLFTCLPAKSESGANCTCAESWLLSSIENAHSVFYGRITKASMQSHDAATIDVWLEPYTQIRGKADETIKLQTYTDSRCGVEVRLGLRYLVVDGDYDKPLTLCSTGAKQIPDRRYVLEKALNVIRLQNDPEGYSEQNLKQLRLEGTWRHVMDVFFHYLDILGLHQTVLEAPNLVRYGPLLFEFSGKQVTSVKEG